MKTFEEILSESTIEEILGAKDKAVAKMRAKIPTYEDISTYGSRAAQLFSVWCFKNKNKLEGLSFEEKKIRYLDFKNNEY